MDIVYMAGRNGYEYLGLRREDLSSWVEGRAMRNPTIKNIAAFIFEDIIYRHGVPGELRSDNSPENAL